MANSVAAEMMSLPSDGGCFHVSGAKTSISGTLTGQLIEETENRYAEDKSQLDTRPSGRPAFVYLTIVGRLVPVAAAQWR